MCPNLRFLVLTVFVRCSIGEQIISACVVPPWSMAEVVWWCFAGDTVCDLFRIQGTLNQHGYHSVLQWYTIPSGLCLVGLPIVFPTEQWPNTPPGCVRAIRVLHQITWPPQSPDLKQLSWFGKSWTAGWWKSNQQVLSMWELLQDCWKSIPGDAGWENAKSVQSCHQGKGWLHWRI